jgi:serine/threonine-protein kinase
MSDATPSRPADRNLLFGILALQMDFIDRDALIAAMNAWVLHKDKPIGQILSEHGRLSLEHFQLLDTLVEAHIKAHGNDPVRSVASLSSVTPLPQDLQAVRDPDVQATLAVACSARTAGDATVACHPPAEDGPGALRYRILRPHARGGLGEVFVAEDQELHREVALKEIQPRHAHNAASRGRFVREAEVTGGLEHPGIVPVYGLGQYADGRPFYAMRFIKGDNLQQAIKRFHECAAGGGRQRPESASERNLQFRQLLRRFIDACNAIGYAHSRGVLHRDVKPGNIMLGKYGETLVVDWGLARSVARPEAETAGGEATLHPTSGSGQSATVMGTALGTPAYMSPEQAAGRLDVLGPASDVYGLGATMYALLTGRAPFPDEEPASTLAKVQRGEFPPPRQIRPAVPAALEAVCLKAMALRPEERYASPRELADEVEHWLADEPVTAYREPPAVRLARWGRRHRTWVAVAVALLVTAVAGLSLGLAVVGKEQRKTQAALDAEARRRQQARDALDAMSSQVVDEWLARQQAGDLTVEQKRFLRQALEWYDELARETGEDQTSRAGVAAAYFRIANLRAKLGQLADAEATYRRGTELYEELAADFPGVPLHRQCLAGIHNSLATLLKDAGRPGEAEAAYRRALTIGEQLAADFPGVADYRHNLAGGYSNLGALLEGTGQPKQAETAFRDALAVQARLVADFPGVAAYQQELARTHTNLGRVLQTAGRPKGAETAFRAALALRKQLAAASPAVPRYRQELADSHNRLGGLLVATGRPKEAEAAYDEALAIQKQLVAVFPSVPAYRSDLTAGLFYLGALRKATGRPREAEAPFRDAVAILKQLAADFPTVPSYRHGLASSQTMLANLWSNAGRPKDAEAAFRDAVALLERLVADFPAVPGYKNDLAQSRNDLGVLLADTGRPQEAQAAYRQALALRRQLVTDFPTVPDYQNSLAGTFVNLGLLLAQGKEYNAARRMYEQALPYHRAALEANPRHPYYRRFYRNNRGALAEALVALGEHRAAAAAASQVVAAAVEPADDAYKAAGLLARCVPLAEKDTHLSDPQRRELTQSYSDQAMAALRQAVRNGYRDTAHMEKDAALDPLHSLADFKQVLRELKPQPPSTKGRARDKAE